MPDPGTAKLPLTAPADRAWWWAAVCGLIAAALSVPDIGRKSFWLDEALSLNATASWTDFPLRMQELHGASWLYYVLLAAWRLVAETDTALRISSAIAGAAAVLITFFVGRRFAGTLGGVLSALVLASNYVFIAHSQELRMYALTAALVCLSALILLHAVEKRSIVPWAACGMLAVLCTASHYFALLAWSAQFGAALLLWHRRIYWPGAALAATVAVAGVVFHVLVFEPRAVASITYLATPRFMELVWTIEKFGGADRPQAALLLGATAVAIASCLIAAHRSQSLVAQFGDFTWLACWLLGPMLGLFVLSHVSTPVFLDRYLVCTIPALALVVGCALARSQPRFLRAALIVAIAGAQAMSYAALRKQDQKEDWRSAAAYFSAHAQPGDAVAFFAYFVEAPFRRYAGLVRPGESSPATQPDAERLYLWHGAQGRVVSFREAEEQLRGMRRVWLVLSHDRLANNPVQNRARDELSAMIDRLRFVEQDARVYPGVGLRLLVAAP